MCACVFISSYLVRDKLSNVHLVKPTLLEKYLRRAFLSTLKTSVGNTDYYLVSNTGHYYRILRKNLCIHIHMYVYLYIMNTLSYFISRLCQPVHDDVMVCFFAQQTTQRYHKRSINFKTSTHVRICIYVGIDARACVSTGRQLTV